MSPASVPNIVMLDTHQNQPMKLAINDYTLKYASFHLDCN